MSPPAVREAAPALAAAIDAIVARLARGGRLVYVGAGTSGRLALVDAAECGPTFGLADGRIVAIVAGGADAHAVRRRRPRTTAWQAPRTSPPLGVGAADAVVALSASGSTPYALGAARRGGRRPAR